MLVEPLAGWRHVAVTEARTKQAYAECLRFLVEERYRKAERTEEQRSYRNGVRPRKLTTRVGQLTLHVPQVREGHFSPELFARYQHSEFELCARSELPCSVLYCFLNDLMNGAGQRRQR